jgi:hypothetical protein
MDDILGKKFKFDDILMWLPANVSFERTGKQWNGSDVYSYELSAESKVMVETQIPVAISDLKKMKEMAEGGRGRIIASKKSIGGWLIGAFELGWAIGEKIDEETGASEKLADWLYDTLGPWPPW